MSMETKIEDSFVPLFIQIMYYLIFKKIFTLQQYYRIHHPEGQWLGRTLEMILLCNNYVLEMLSSLPYPKCLGHKSRTSTNRVKH